MSEAPPNLDQLEAEFPHQAKFAFSRAYRETLEAGVPVVVLEKGEIVRVSPDGSRTVLKTAQPWTTTKAGTRYKLS